MLELLGVYLLIHLIMVFIGFNIARMDQVRSQRYFPLVAWSALFTALLHWAVQQYLQLPDNILSGLIIGCGGGLIVLLCARILLGQARSRLVTVASVVAFADLIIATMLLR